MLVLYIILGALALWALYDIIQSRHAVMRNFPIIGHFRYWLEAVGPELRQYIVTNNDEERPFSRDQRRWVYTSSKNVNNYFGFGTDNDLELEPNYIIIKHAAFPVPEPIPHTPQYDANYTLPCAKVLGGARGRAKAFRPESVFNISGMSYGSLSGNAISALNMGAAKAGCMHNTGEGGLSPYHQKGGDIMWQIGTAYFGCRDADGRFSMDLLKEKVEANPVKALEIKLSQGAKPSKGGILPAAKITAEIARIRNIPMGQDCISPSAHAEFSDVDSMLDFVERMADATGLPVGIKSAVGETAFWEELARQMESGNRMVDFITIDGGEGGTGAAPLAYADHVSLPFKLGFSRVYSIMARHNLHEKIVFIGSGRLGFPQTSLVAFSLGADMVHVAREAMLSIGCIQAQRCHVGHCPAGVATQNRWLARGLNPHLKADRVANYIKTLRKEVLALCRSCGVHHPALIHTQHLELMDGQLKGRPVTEVFDYDPAWGLPSAADQAAIRAIMEALPDRSALVQGAD